MKAIYALIILAIGITIATTNTSLTVTGTVIDAVSGDPITGASVLVKGTQQESSTDLSGNFKIKVLAIGEILLISHTGYTT